MKEFGEWLSHNIMQTIIVLSIFIQISPIKWNPLTSLCRWIGGLITSDLKDQIQKLDDKVKLLSEDVDANEEDRIRWEILDFANACRNGRKHTKEEFIHIITLKDKYEKLLEKSNKTNGYFTAEYAYIAALYAERQSKNDFL